MLEIKTKNNSFKVNISKELSDYLFTILVSTATESISQMEIFKPVQDIDYLVKGEKTPTNIIKETIKEMDRIASDLNTKPTTSKPYAPIEEKKHRLVVTICPKCGKRHTIYFNGNTIKCTCGHHIDFDDSELINSSYECPHCGEGQGRFKALGQIDSIPCLKCKKEVLLDYDTQTRTYKQVY